MMNDEINAYGIVRMGDRFGLVREYADGSRSEPYGEFGSIEEIEATHGSCSVPLIDRTDEDDEGGR
jgi:hypothetical protein